MTYLRMPRRHNEAVLQRQVATWLAFASRGLAWTYCAINPNPVRGSVQGAIAKGMGLRAGWPDFAIVYQGRALFVELKTEKGRLSDAQVACHAELEDAGAQVGVCRSLDEVVAFLVENEVPLAARFG